MTVKINEQISGLIERADKLGNNNGKLLDCKQDICVFMHLAKNAGYSKEDILEITQRVTKTNCIYETQTSGDTKDNRSMATKLGQATLGAATGFVKGVVYGATFVPALFSGIDRASRAESFAGEVWGVVSALPGLNVVAEMIDGAKAGYNHNYNPQAESQSQILPTSYEELYNQIK